jgi:RNA polymerase sigma factor (sigma-70 family)
MPKNSSNGDAESAAATRAARIRSAVKQEHEQMLRSVAMLVAKTDHHLRWSDVMERAHEILDQAVEEALKHADGFDPTQSARAWIRGIASRLLANRRRVEARERRCVSATTLGEEGWATALERLCTEPADAVVGGRLDLEQALCRISAEERRAIHLRYYQGLDGEELASALGVPTPGAARVRVCRALQALRTHFAPTEGEVLP